MNFAIIGAGMAGLACASALIRAGHRVTLFDKGRGPGGRMSTRRLSSPLGDVAIDHGAQYFTVRHPEFRQLVGQWHDQGVVAPWPALSADAWIGTPGMNAVIRHMAADHHVVWGRAVAGMMRKDGQWWLIDETGASDPFDGLIVATPAEQAASLLSLHDLAMARVAQTARSEPCWTTMLVFDKALANIAPVIRKKGMISWASSNSAKPGRSGPEAWVVQACAAWTLQHLETEPQDISPLLTQALFKVAGQPPQDPVHAVSHRWRYAIAAGTGDGALWNVDLGLGACGDWLLGPRVESAWLSGTLLARRCLGADHSG